MIFFQHCKQVKSPYLPDNLKGTLIVSIFGNKYYEKEVFHSKSYNGGIVDINYFV